jgi:hypothetical protein
LRFIKESAKESKIASLKSKVVRIVSKWRIFHLVIKAMLIMLSPKLRINNGMRIIGVMLHQKSGGRPKKTKSLLSWLTSMELKIGKKLRPFFRPGLMSNVFIGGKKS